MDPSRVVTLLFTKFGTSPDPPTAADLELYERILDLLPKKKLPSLLKSFPIFNPYPSQNNKPQIISAPGAVKKNLDGKSISLPSNESKKLKSQESFIATTMIELQTSKESQICDNSQILEVPSSPFSDGFSPSSLQNSPDSQSLLDLESSAPTVQVHYNI